jgi:hypothetical protein
MRGWSAGAVGSTSRPWWRGVSRFVTLVRRLSSVLDVPGTPRSLRLDGVAFDGGVAVLRWSFKDPESFSGDRVAHGRRIHGELEVPYVHGVTEEAARSAWARVQLDAAYRYKSQVDADWIPGEPFVRRVWTPDDAWQGLLTFLGREGAEVRQERGELHATYGPDDQNIYRIDPHEWATYLTGPITSEVFVEAEESDIVPAATPDVDGLPLWATDELSELAGTYTLIALVDGRLTGVERNLGS